MTLAALLNRACTITSRTWGSTIDDYGNQVATTATISIVCELQQRQRDETPGELAETTWLLILPAGTSITAADTITADGVDYELTGDPWEARNPRTAAVSHIEATVKRAAGREEA